MTGETRILSAEGGLRPGVVLNDLYVIESLIGSGGMGRVFKARAIDTGDDVAIKTIQPDLVADETVLGLFRREASALRTLNHDAIVRYFVFSAGGSTGVPYLAMEYVAGEHLLDLLKKGPVGFEPLTVLLWRLASGLQAAHDLGVVHRDLSPDNVVLPGGDVHKAKLIDFGIARTASPEGTIIGPRFAGKHAYAAPEQLGLFGGQITPKTDIYALGLIIAEAARGRPLDMGGDPLQTIEKRRRVPDLTGVDDRLRPLIERMLAPDPKDRPASMAEIAAWRPEPSDDSRGSRAGLLLAAGLAALAAAGFGVLVVKPELVGLGRAPQRDAPAQSASSAPKEEETFEAALAARMQALVPRLSKESVENRVRGYVQAKEHKAQAVSYRPFGTWRTTDRESREAAAEKTLEGCQVQYGQPCALIAVNDRLESLPPDGTDPPRRDMPRASYSGLFDPERIPAAWASARQPSDVLGYRGSPSPKAAAYHPWGRVFTATGASDQRSAESRALDACNADPVRKGADGPCFLYAVGDRVVLPQRRGEPLTAAAVSAPPDAPASFEGGLLDWFARANPDLSLPERRARAGQYQDAAPYKAQAVAPGTRVTWYVWKRASPQIAEEKALEGCQVFANQPCVLAALDDRLMPLPAGGPWVRRDMPRVGYSGPFDLDKVPALVESVRERSDVYRYPSAPEPKAVAYHPWGRLFVSTGAPSQSAAEEQALRECNADPDRRGANGPCFLYARGNRVVLPERRTAP